MSKTIIIAEDNKRNNQAGSNTERSGSKDGSIGNQQYTTQTGVQNAGGKNTDQEEDNYTEDPQRSGDRSSNRKSGS